MSLSNDDVLQILALLDASDFDELRLETSDYKLHVRRSGALAAHNGAAVPAPAAAPVADPAAGAASRSSSAGPSGTTDAPASSAAALAPAAGNLIDVKTPLLGTFYRAPQPGAPPFVDVGSAVGPDTVVGIVEVMKLMSSISAGAAGTVVEVLASDGGLVEYGQVLMRLAPSAA